MNNTAEKILAKSDPILAKVMSEISRPNIVSTHEVFHDLMSCILEQQIHYRSTKKIFQKMLHTADIQILNPSNFQILEEKVIANTKLSASKYETILYTLGFWNTNNIDWNLLTNEEVNSKLSGIKGIGNWTIDMILLYTLQRPNIFPYEDFHLKQIMVGLYDLNPKVKLKAQMIEISKLWGDHKSIAVLYLLAWKQIKKGI
jgi:DNA-3-methyladenine glycosylase II